LDLVYDEGSNISWQSFSPSILELVNGVEYCILLDDKEYVLTALES
jgi:hypothetical protein